MKKLIVLSLLTVMLLGGDFLAPAHAQTPANDLKPTFISPTPGLYVSGWPAFTVSYPKKWVETLPFPGQDFRVGAARTPMPPLPELGIAVFVNFAPLSDMAQWYIRTVKSTGKDFKVVYDKPTKLKDSTPAREAEIEWTMTGLTGAHAFSPMAKRNTFLLGAKRESAWISLALSDEKGRIGNDLKRIAYSLRLQPGKEKPVQVPPDVGEFLDKWHKDIVDGDVAMVMSNVSDRFNYNGMDKAAMEQWMRDDPSSPLQAGLASLNTTVTVFEVRGDQAYLSGFNGGKLKSGAPAPITPLGNMQIIKENGQWKWYGNHKQ